MEKVQCPVCGAAADGGYSVGDDTLFICPKCGGYRLAGTAIELLENGTLQKPDPKRFRDLVSRKRGKSTEYPVITSGDLRG
jgi:Zn-finger nucleic acid-binding protein